MTYFNSIAAQYEDMATFVFVYIAEAHAQDEWPISQLDKEIMRHQTLADRLAAAIGFLQAFPMHEAYRIVLDSMEDSFNAAFASWPFRSWVVLDGALAFKAQPREANYDVTELGAWLEGHRRRVAAQ